MQILYMKTKKGKNHHNSFYPKKKGHNKMKKLIIIPVILLVCLYSLPVSAQESAISLGKTYESITPASSAYPDTSAQKLTNGVFASPTASDTSASAQSYYKSAEYVGFNQASVDTNGNFVILLDLGSVATNLSSFEVSYLNETDVGIYSPASVTFSVSDVRNGNYTSVGIAQLSDSTTAGVVETKKATITPDGAINGQYIKIEIKPQSSFTDVSGGTVTPGWVFLDEITVSGTASNVNSNISNDSITIPMTGEGGSLIVFAFLSITAVIALSVIVSKRKSDENK
jgi:hypothetical protein